MTVKEGSTGVAAPEENEEEIEETETEETEGESEEEGSGESDKDEKNPELAKAIRARDRAKQQARRLQAQLEEATKTKDDKPDPIAQANRRLVTSSTRAVLAAGGVTDKEDQKTIISILNLSDIEVDDEDGPDEDAIEEKIEDLRRIFGAKETRGTRVPKGVKAKDPSGGKGEQTDADAARYRRFIGGR